MLAPPPIAPGETHPDFIRWRDLAKWAADEAEHAFAERDRGPDNPYLELFEAVNGPTPPIDPSDPDAAWTRRFSMHNIHGIVAREPMVRQFAWAVPNDEALAAIAAEGPIVEIGAGKGYWAWLLRKRGVNIRAFDQLPPGFGNNRYHSGGAWTEVEHGSCRVLVNGRFHQRALFLCWPPYDTRMAWRALQSYRGKTVIVVGEPSGGCTGNDGFWERLELDFDAVNSVEIPQWAGIHDALTVWKRR